jgi:lipoic acid synthetase
MNHSSPRKPDWLKVRLPGGPNFARIDQYHRDRGLLSVCRSAASPNQGECWSRGIATFMILGNICTRDCAFCNIGHGQPPAVDPAEPDKVAAAIAELGLNHAVITSVTRDDLADGGAEHFSRMIAALRRHAPHCRIELLIPDLSGNWPALAKLLTDPPDILGHNIETVPTLYPAVRGGADYQRSLALLAEARRLAPELPVKSGIMVGLGETRDEIASVMTDLHSHGCSLLTIGQYLAPSRRHHPVSRYIPPAEFAELKDAGLRLGFAHVESGPLVRSSYHAEIQFEKARPTTHRQSPPA